ncbi:MAG: putative zinc-binding peptidase [Gammaproteobacteria bacterium]|nr:putative zinc-binding peptidase [Gammaproteobacteria bacterium]
MQIWTCSGCEQTLFFDNAVCPRCAAGLGFLPDRLDLATLDAAGDGTFRVLGTTDGPTYRLCANKVEHDACNWTVPAEDAEPLCRACRLNHTIPDLTADNNLTLWRRLEAEKRRLVYSMLRFGLPTANKIEDPEHGLGFDFLADAEPEFREGPGVITGHADGLITLNVAEADHAVRERMRQQMAEPYRTILGHFRHESGHYYWDRLVRDSSWLEPVRACFGDDRLDYSEALQRHYESDASTGWSEHFVSHYASSHPWEDWAETWAHYLHIVDTLETAWQFGMRAQPKVEEASELSFRPPRNPYRESDFDALIEAWIPLTQALNSLNRSVGQEDAYPFALAQPAIDKLKLVHDIIRDTTGSGAS